MQGALKHALILCTQRERGHVDGVGSDGEGSPWPTLTGLRGLNGTASHRRRGPCFPPLDPHESDIVPRSSCKNCKYHRHTSLHGCRTQCQRPVVFSSFLSYSFVFILFVFFCIIFLSCSLGFKGALDCLWERGMAKNDPINISCL